LVALVDACTISLQSTKKNKPAAGEFAFNKLTKSKPALF
jgi:hypothetical protein